MMQIREDNLSTIVFKPSAVARVLGAVALFFVVLSTAGQLVKYLTGHDELMGLLSLTYVDDEWNFPTLFSVLLLAVASLFLAVVSVLARKQKDPDTWRWAVLSFGFLYLAFDEGLALHERLGDVLRALLGQSAESELPTSYLVIRGLIAAVILGLLFSGFLRRLPARTRFSFLFGGALYLGGAVVIDILGAKWVVAHTEQNLTFVFIATVEEICEMAGVILFIYALLRYLADTYGEVRFLLGERSEAARGPEPSGPDSARSDWVPRPEIPGLTWLCCNGIFAADHSGRGTCGCPPPVTLGKGVSRFDWAGSSACWRCSWTDRVAFAQTKSLVGCRQRTLVGSGKLGRRPGPRRRRFAPFPLRLVQPHDVERHPRADARVRHRDRFGFRGGWRDRHPHGGPRLSQLERPDDPGRVGEDERRDRETSSTSTAMS